ncbi:MAG TPA: hypothetical protein VHL11_24405 [Phototrophicaceae bacterium]|jgi:hypothetical protein|nr:hypothetical protein [Phototrophicaceae bacterium]
MTDLSISEDWVNLNEAAQITGYNRVHLLKLAQRIFRKPEEDREIKIRRRSNGYDMWLPDLMKYRNSPSHGPQRKRKTPPGS